MSASSLDRFHLAQARDFAHALDELGAGRKRSHWIWYVFPQLAGLGRSAAALAYGLQGADEAAAYLRDPVLRDRLLAAASAVRSHLDRDPPAPLRVLMGSEIDVMKLVSSMTLFREIGRRAGDDAIAATADAILRAAKAQGFGECEFTLTQLHTASS